MNYPYASKKWMAAALSAMMLATAAPAAFAETANPTANPTQTQTPAKAPAQAEVLTLERAIEQALKTNTDLVNQRLEASTADYEARLLVSSTSEISSSMIETVEAAKGKYETEARAEMIRKLNNLSVKAAESRTKLGAQKAFYDLLHAQAEVELRKQSLNRAQTQLKVAKAAFEVGTKAKTDILQAEMGVAGAQAQLAVAENNLEIARMQLNQFLGVDLERQWVLENENKQLVAPKLSMEDAIAQALQKRVEVVQKEEEYKLAQINVDIIQKYSALSTYQGKVARNDMEKARLAIDQTKRTVSLEVSQAYLNLNAAKLNVEFMKKAQEAAAESYRLTNLRFENGLATTLEVIQAEEELSDRENQYQQALHNYNLAVVNFETALGN